MTDSPHPRPRRLPTTPRFYRLRQVSRNPHTGIHEMLQEYGDLMRWRGLADIYIVNHPDLIRPVLTQDYRHFSKNTIHYRMLRQVMGNGLVTNDGPDWVRQRRLIQPAFASRRLARFDDTINALTSSLVARWDGRNSTEVVWIDREMSALTFDIVGETLFGCDIEEHASAMAQILDVVNLSDHDLRAFLTLYPRIPTPYNLKWKRAMRRLDRIVYGLIGGRGQGGDGSDDLLDRLFAARDEETGEGMDDKQIRDEVVTLMLAGHETSAMALSWTLYLLATHPDVEERLCEHLEASLHGAPAETEELARLSYLKQVVQEAMRLYPPVWGYVRRAERETELGGYVLPANAWVGVVTYALHRHPGVLARRGALRSGPVRAGPGSGPRFLCLPALRGWASNLHRGRHGDARDPIDPRAARAAIPDSRRPRPSDRDGGEGDAEAAARNPGHPEPALSGAFARSRGRFRTAPAGRIRLLTLEAAPAWPPGYSRENPGPEK